MPDHSRRNLLLSIFGAASIPAFADEPKPAVPAYNNISDEQEVSLGRDLSREIEKQEKMKFIENHSLHNYANEVLQRLVKSSRRPNLPFSLKIVDTASVNASALPGGFVYLNRGLMQWARNEAEMASVLAHEVGHVVGHHGTNNIARAKSADSLLSEASRILLGDDSPAKLLEQLGGPVAALTLLKYDRYQESEADLLGCYNMQRAGWDPQGMVSMFKRLAEASGGMDSVLVITSDHPASSDRADQISQEIKNFPPPGNLKLDSDAFKSMQLELKKLPPPPTHSRFSSEN